MTMKKLVYCVLFSVLALFIVQNMGLVTVSFLVWEFTLPRAVILGVTFSLGALAGFGVVEIRHHQKTVKSVNL